MTLKEFSIGQRAFIAEIQNGRQNEIFIKPATVTKVGRKYVSTSGSELRRFEETPFGVSYLTEDCNYGYPGHLFSTEEKALEYKELKELQLWFIRLHMNPNINRYTIDQLRAVKAILDGAESGQKMDEGTEERGSV